ncbi:MAG: hypothetical protein R3240_09495 [Gammaproteobacteria bacterium]|nr:hypothetical protein [Gammaproteobacteria bacterium]
MDNRNDTPVNDPFAEFARLLAREVLENDQFIPDPDNPQKVQTTRDDQEVITLDLTPFKAKVQPVSAARYFSSVDTVPHLLSAYEAAKHDHVFETNYPDAMINVSSYTEEFLQTIFTRAQQSLTDSQAVLVGKWLAELDVYTAVKSVESLLNSRADVALLEEAEQRNWTVHFDHLAIRCGSKARGDAERVVEMLNEYHGYVSTQIPEEAFYQFPDGWNAYPLYKILENGQVLRLFIDQSDADNRAQIIQHWNHVYGYTAHHLAIRATTVEDEQRLAIPLTDIMNALNQRGIGIMTPTGEYTSGLLLQVFTRPEKNTTIPDTIKQSVAQISPELAIMIENGKLLELVSRKEMTTDKARRLFDLYGLKYDVSNPAHSAPVYQYFLPAQAAHVIRTSVQTS